MPPIDYMFIALMIIKVVGKNEKMIQKYIIYIVEFKL